MIDTARQDWARRWAALHRYTTTTVKGPALGQWVAELRRTYGAGHISFRRAEGLERLGAWEVDDRDGVPRRIPGRLRHHGIVVERNRGDS